MWLPTSLLVLATTTAFARFTDPDGFEDGSDLESFVTRPDIAAPKYIVTKHHPEAIEDGYWFVAPYSGLFARPNPGFRKEHVNCQTGAHIYDNDGALVWSGACKYTNRNVYGFKPVMINGTQHLSLHQAGEGVGDGIPKVEANVLLDQHYEEVRRLTKSPRGGLDLHEFRVLPGGLTAVVAIQDIMKFPLTTPGAAPAKRQEPNPVLSKQPSERMIIDPGFFEMDLLTNETLFEWSGMKRGISLLESWDLKGQSKLDLMWDYAHINSVDKDSDGNYYVSLRHTHTIYKISGEDKNVIWRLGGQDSNFTMGTGVSFQWQHHIRVRFHNSTHTIVSLFDNGSEDEDRSLKQLAPYTSTAKIIVLDTQAMTATLMRSVARPDQGMSEKLGSVQLLGIDAPVSDPRELEKAPLFVDWALPGYISEYDSSNRLVMEAQFASDRMKTYRAYKYKFVGKPKDRPVMRLLPMAYTQDGHEIASVFYVSWNGATEVRTWRFHGGASESGPFEKLGTANKNGFETSWVIPGRVDWGFAEAVDEKGVVLGKSYLVRLESTSNRHFPIPHSNPPGSSLELDASSPSDPAAPVDVEEGREYRVVHKTLFSLLMNFLVYGFACAGMYWAWREKALPQIRRWWNKRRAHRRAQSWHGAVKEDDDRALLPRAETPDEKRVRVREDEI